MVRVTEVLTVVIAMVASSQGNGDSLEPVQTLAPMKSKMYTPLRERYRYIDEKDLTYDTDDYVRKLNPIIRQYLITFDEIRGLSKDPQAQSSMKAVKLLVVQSWISMLKPKFRMLFGIIDVDESMNLYTARNKIVSLIKQIDSVTPISDSILYYKRFVQRRVQEEFLNRVHLAHVANDAANAYLDRVTDTIAKLKLTKQGNEYRTRMDEYNAYLDFIHITFIMCLQSYIKNFMKSAYGDSFNVISSSGLDKMEFVTPFLGDNDFHQIFTYGQLESKALANYKERIMQNIVITRYLDQFDGFIDTTESEKNSLTIIKMLIIQSWLYMLQPDMETVEKILPTVRKGQSLEEVKGELVNTLLSFTANPVKDAISIYSSNLESKIHIALEKKVFALHTKIDAEFTEQNGELTPSSIENFKKNAELKEDISFHSMTLKMCIQSYVLNFLRGSNPKKIEIRSTFGHSEEFTVPPLTPDSFSKMAN